MYGYRRLIGVADGPTHVQRACILVKTVLSSTDECVLSGPIVLEQSRRCFRRLLDLSLLCKKCPSKNHILEKG